MDSEIPPVIPLKLKVEINSREHFAVLGVQRKRFSLDSPWITMDCDIATFCLEEMLGTKMRALYQRRKGRDLFDLWLGLTEGRADPRRIVECFRRCMAHGGQTVSRSEFELNLAAKRDHPGFATDLRDLLPVGTDYDFETGFATVQQELIAPLAHRFRRLAARRRIPRRPPHLGSRGYAKSPDRIPSFASARPQGGSASFCGSCIFLARPACASHAPERRGCNRALQGKHQAIGGQTAGGPSSTSAALRACRALVRARDLRQLPQFRGAPSALT